jgi:hypothetical protein
MIVKTKVLAVFVGLLFAASLVVAGEEQQSAWAPQFGVDVLQPSFNVAGSVKQPHVTLAGAHLSLFRTGRFRYPTAGLDFQVRLHEDAVEQKYWRLGFFLFSTGVKYVLSEKQRASYGAVKEWGIHFKVQIANRADPDPHIGRVGFATGVYIGW